MSTRGLESYSNEMEFQRTHTHTHTPIHTFGDSKVAQTHWGKNAQQLSLVNTRGKCRFVVIREGSVSHSGLFEGYYYVFTGYSTAAACNQFGSRSFHFGTCAQMIKTKVATLRDQRVEPEIIINCT